MNTSVTFGGTGLTNPGRCWKVGVTLGKTWSGTSKETETLPYGARTAIHYLRGHGFTSTATAGSNMFKRLRTAGKLTICCHCPRNKTTLIHDPRRRCPSGYRRFSFWMDLVGPSCIRPPRAYRRYPLLSNSTHGKVEHPSRQQSGQDLISYLTAAINKGRIHSSPGLHKLRYHLSEQYILYE